MADSNWLDENWYPAGAWLFGGIAFIAGWIYAIAAYGFFLGVGLGWFPAAILAVLVGLLWPVLAALIGLAVGSFLVFTDDGKELVRRMPTWVSLAILSPLVLYWLYERGSAVRSWWAKRSGSRHP